MKIVSGILLLVALGLNLQHGWAPLVQRTRPGQANLLADLGISGAALYGLGVTNLLSAVLLVFPSTFLVGNLLSAGAILLIMVLALRAGNYHAALFEVPFLLLPLTLMWLKHPLAK